MELQRSPPRDLCWPSSSARQHAHAAARSLSSIPRTPCTASDQGSECWTLLAPLPAWSRRRPQSPAAALEPLLTVSPTTSSAE